MVSRVFLVIAALTLGSATASAQTSSTSPAAAPRACDDADWVSFAPHTPYTPAVADVAAVVWLPNLLFPCPSLFLAIGQAQIPTASAPDAQATGIAFGHSVFIACCAPTLAATVVGLPLALLETLWIAPISTLNALDRDHRCAEARKPAPTVATPPRSASPTVERQPTASDPLPPPPPAPGGTAADIGLPPPMAF